MPDITKLDRNARLRMLGIVAARQQSGWVTPPQDDILDDPDIIVQRPLPPMPSIVNFDFKKPDYKSVFEERNALLRLIRGNPELLDSFKLYYRHNIADFISDWGLTYDPRNAGMGIPTHLPFILFERQREWVDYALRKWKAKERGLTDKSRECGISWLAIAMSCGLCIFNRGMAIGFGSALARDVDTRGEPKSLFEKLRMFMRNLPPEFQAGWSEKCSPLMRTSFPATGSVISGEGGDEIGRGGRTSIYIIDEAAYLEHPKAVDAALSQTTNCRIDVSTVRGMSNPFAVRRHSGNVEVFSFNWKDDPRKGQEWYEMTKKNIDDPVILAQEVDMDYMASVTGVIIPHVWVLGCIDAHIQLGIEPTGKRLAALDVADEGADLNAIALGTGILIEYVEEWSGKGSDIFATAQRAFNICDEFDLTEMRFDSDGLGADIRGDARVINEQRIEQHMRKIEVVPYRGTAGVFQPDSQDVKGRQNKDYFFNRKSQSWWSLRRRFERTYRWINEGLECDPDDIISISSAIPNSIVTKLANELGRPTYSLNGVGKIIVDKNPNGSKSPNLADAVCIRYAPMEGHFKMDHRVLDRFQKMQIPRNRFGPQARDRFARSR